MGAFITYLYLEKGIKNFQKLRNEGQVKTDVHIKTINNNILHVEINGVKLPNNEYIGFWKRIE